MDDPVKIYDSVRGTQWLEGRGYGTLTTGRTSKKQQSSNNWTNIFTTWKKKGKTSSENKKTTCHEAFSPLHSSSQTHHQLYSQSHPQQPTRVSSQQHHPHHHHPNHYQRNNQSDYRADAQQQHHQLHGNNIAKFCSLSTASGTHYLSTNGNHNESNGNFYGENTPCNRMMIPSRRLPPLPSIHSLHVPSSTSATVRLPSSSSNSPSSKRGSLFATEWDSSSPSSYHVDDRHHLPLDPSSSSCPVSLESSRHSSDFGQCTCHAVKTASSSCCCCHDRLEQQDCSFNARYSDSLKHFCHDQSCNLPHDHQMHSSNSTSSSSSLPKSAKRHKQVTSLSSSSSTSSPAKNMMMRMKQRRSESSSSKTPSDKKGVLVSHIQGTPDHHLLQESTSQSRTCHHLDQGLNRSINGFSCASHHDSSDGSMNHAFTDKKPTKFSSSTISAGFVRALKKSSREPSSSSSSNSFVSSTRRKSIFNPELSAYDLIKRQLQEEGLDDDILLEEDDVVNGELFSMDHSPSFPSKGGFKCSSLRCPSSVVKAEYLSKNLRIAGQGVTLFPWEEPFHSVKTSNSAVSSPSTISQNRSSSLKRDSLSSSTNGFCESKKSQEGRVSVKEIPPESMSNIVVPEPDYDLSDDSCEGEVIDNNIPSTNGEERLNSSSSLQNNDCKSFVHDQVIPTSIEICSSRKSVEVKENAKHSSRTSCLNNESPYFVTSPPTSGSSSTTSTPSVSSSSSESNQHHSLQQQNCRQQENSNEQQKQLASKTSFTRSILKKTSSSSPQKQGGLRINEEFDRQQQPPLKGLNSNGIKSGNNNNTPDSSHSSGSTFASSSSSLVNSVSQTSKAGTANNKSNSSSPSCMNNGKNLIKKSSTSGQTSTSSSTSCKTQTASQSGNNSTTNGRKTPMMMMLKLNNKRSHRKHVTFRSHRDDGSSLILDHITEAIPEEDESLYDDVQEEGPFESLLKKSQVNHEEIESRLNGIRQASQESSCQDEDSENCQERESHVFAVSDGNDDDDEVIHSPKNSKKLSTVNLIHDSVSGSSGPLDSQEEDDESRFDTKSNGNNKDHVVTGISSSSDHRILPRNSNISHNQELQQQSPQVIKSESKRGYSVSHAEQEARRHPSLVVSKRHEPEEDESEDILDSGFGNQRLHEDEQEEECDNENEYYDHLPGRRSNNSKTPFSIAFYNNLSDEPVPDNNDRHLGRQGEISDTESGLQTAEYDAFDSKDDDDVYDDRLLDDQEKEFIEGENNGNKSVSSRHFYRHHNRHDCHDRDSSSPEALSSSNFKPVFKAHVNSTSKSNKIVIDVPSAKSYETLGQQREVPVEEHIYEELLPVGQQHPGRSPLRSPIANNEEDGELRSMFDGASKDEILEYLEDAKERVSILITADKSVFGISDFDIERLNDNLDHHMSCPSLDQVSPSSGILTNTLASNSSSSTFASSAFASSTSSSVNSSASSSASSSRRNRSSNVSNSSTESGVTTCSSDGIDEEPAVILTDRISPPITRSVSLTQLVERNDSGVGTETSKPSLLRRCVSGETEQRCTDCEQLIDPAEDEVSGIMFFPLTCSVCDKKRSERKEIVSEFVDTEFKYGRDLRIIKEEFYRPMEVAGLMTKDQLKSVFINLDELIRVNSRFAEKLQDALEIALEQGDEDYTTINLGRLFIESSATMLHAFETYCSHQGTASLILTQLEKEKELLRIFLRVSQMENALLRRMNLSAFLMVPVQRVTKYPLLLNRLCKVTPLHHQDRDVLRAAQQMVELHLEHINQQTKATPNKMKHNLFQKFFNSIKLQTPKSRPQLKMDDRKSK